MDQEIRTQKEGAGSSSSLIRQQQREKSLNALNHKEQQEATEKDEDVDRRREPQAETKKNQRGPYRQYEDTDIILEKIRYYRTQRYPDSEIMKLLDNMPRRTYYNFVKKLQEQERQIAEQWMSEHIEHYAEELMIYRETLCQKLREIQGIIDNEKDSPKDKMQAITQYLAITEKLVNFERSGRVDEMRYVKNYISTLY